MKIAIVTQSYYPRPGGVTENVYHSAIELQKRGHRVTVITSKSAEAPPRRPHTIRVGRNILVPMNGAWVNMAVGLGLAAKLARILEDLDPDIIHTQCPLVPTLPLLALRAAPRRAVVIGTFHAAAEGNFAYHLLRKPLNRYAGRLDMRIAVSEAALALASRYFPGSYTIIPNGVDSRRFSPDVKPIRALRDGSFNILFVGRLDKRKGLKYLFRALSRASRKARRKLRIIVAGESSPRKFLLPRLPGKIEVVFTGFVPKEILPRYYASCDLFCSPAVGKESFGIVLLEAMASGVPVVGTAIPGYLTILKQNWNAAVVPPRDPEALCQAILELEQNGPLRRRLRENGLEFVQAYSWEKIACLLERAYQEAIASTGSALPRSEEPLEESISG